MEVIVWIIATIVWAVAYAIAEIRLSNLKIKYYDALHKNIDLEERLYDLEKERELREKYEKYLISQYEKVYAEKSKLEWQNERLREQVEFFERELSTEEADEKETTNLHKGE